MAPMAPPAAAPMAGAGSARPVTAAGDTIATLQASGQFTQFLKAADLANLTSVLKGQNVTVFVPTDAAFAAASPSQKAALAASDHGQRLLAYHVVNTRVEPTQLQGAFGPVPNVVNGNVYLDGTKQPFKASNANVLQAGITTSNGVIWVIDQIIDPNYTAPPPTPVEAPAAPAAAAATPQTPGL